MAFLDAVEAVTLGKLLIVVGLAVVGLGGLVLLAQFLPAGFRPFRLPGDIRIEREGFSFYFPITTMVLFSVVISLVLRLFRR